MQQFEGYTKFSLLEIFNFILLFTEQHILWMQLTHRIEEGYSQYYVYLRDVNNKQLL